MSSTQEHVLSQSRSHYIKAKVNTSHHLKKIDELQASMKKCHQTLARTEQELAEAQWEKEELEKTWRVYEEQFREQRMSQGMDVELDESQVSVFKKTFCIINASLMYYFVIFLADLLGSESATKNSRSCPGSRVQCWVSKPRRCRWMSRQSMMIR